MEGQLLQRAPDQVETQAQALAVARDRRARLVERIPDALPFPGCHPDAVVGDPDQDPVVAGNGLQHDAPDRRPAIGPQAGRPGELDRIADQVHEDPEQRFAVRMDGQGRIAQDDPELQPALPTRVLEDPTDAMQDGLEPDIGDETRCPARIARFHQQVVDTGLHLGEPIGELDRLVVGRRTLPGIQLGPQDVDVQSRGHQGLAKIVADGGDQPVLLGDGLFCDPRPLLQLGLIVGNPEPLDMEPALPLLDGTGQGETDRVDHGQVDQCPQVLLLGERKPETEDIAGHRRTNADQQQGPGRQPEEDVEDEQHQQDDGTGRDAAIDQQPERRQDGGGHQQDEERAEDQIVVIDGELRRQPRGGQQRQIESDQPQPRHHSTTAVTGAAVEEEVPQIAQDRDDRDDLQGRKPRFAHGTQVDGPGAGIRLVGCRRRKARGLQAGCSRHLWSFYRRDCVDRNLRASMRMSAASK